MLSFHLQLLCCFEGEWQYYIFIGPYAATVTFVCLFTHFLHVHALTRTGKHTHKHAHTHTHTHTHTHLFVDIALCCCLTRFGLVTPFCCLLPPLFVPPLLAPCWCFDHVGWTLLVPVPSIIHCVALEISLMRSLQRRGAVVMAERGWVGLLDDSNAKPVSGLLNGECCCTPVLVCVRRWPVTVQMSTAVQRLGCVHDIFLKSY